MTETSVGQPIVRIDAPATLRLPLLAARRDELSLLTLVGTPSRRAGDSIIFEHRSGATDQVQTLAPVAGEVVGPCLCRTVGGDETVAVEFRTAADDNNAPVSAEPPDEPPSLGRLIQWMSATGIDARRVTSPRLVAQLERALARPVDRLVVSVLDDSAEAPVNARLFELEQDRAIAAMTTLAEQLGATLTVAFGSLPQFRLVELRQRLGPSARVTVLGESYPLSHPTMLLYSLFRAKLAAGKLPTDVSVVLLDLAALLSVAHLFDHPARPIRWPIMIVDHRGRRREHLVTAPSGTTIAQIAGQLDLGLTDTRLLAGDVLRRNIATPDDVVGPGETIVHVTPAADRIVPDPCVRCGWCLDACPTGLHPAGVLDAAQRDDRDAARSFGINACIECGICNYVCPSRLPIVESVRRLRTPPDAQ